MSYSTQNGQLKTDSVHIEASYASLMKEFRNELMEHNAQVQLELVRTVLEDFDKRVSRLHPLCSLSQSLPEIHSSHLKNLEIPLIHATKLVSPGFFVQIEKLANHITMHTI